MSVTTTVIRRGWLLAAGAALAASAAGVTIARAQQGQPASSAPPSLCAPRSGFLNETDREAVGRIFMNRVKEKVGLSDQQAEDIRATMKSARDAARGDRQAMCEARMELRRLMDDKNSAPAAVKAAGDQVKALQAKLMDRRLDTYLALRAKLNTDQWNKWLDLRRERGGHWRGRFRG